MNKCKFHFVFCFLYCTLCAQYTYADRINVSYKIAWCSAQIPAAVEQNYHEMRVVLARRSTLILPENLLANSCSLGQADIWWFEGQDFKKFPLKKLEQHIANGGAFVVEGAENNLQDMESLNNYSVGVEWEEPAKNGLFYRSFYLLQSLDGCAADKTKVLMLKKKINAKAPLGVLTKAHFLSDGNDCFSGNLDYKTRSFINIMFAFMTTDYKEDQRELPEILNRVRNLGLEP